MTIDIMAPMSSKLKVLRAMNRLSPVEQLILAAAMIRDADIDRIIRGATRYQYANRIFNAHYTEHYIEAIRILKARREREA